jgi:DNA-binding NtrC family response regulator
MPEMDGGKCLHKLKQINPEVKVIMSSGYSFTGFSNDFSNEGAKAFISKPYELKRMLEAIRNVLDEVPANQ